MKLVTNVIISVCIVCAGCVPVRPPQEERVGQGTIAVIHDQDLPTVKHKDSSGGRAEGPWEKSKEAMGNLWHGCRQFAYAAPGDPFTLTIFLAGTVICVAATPFVAAVGAIRGVIGEKTGAADEETEFSGEKAGTGTAPDTTPPLVSTTPSAGALSVPINTSITALFSEVMDAATINGTTFTLNNSVTGAVTCDTTNHIAKFVPSGSLVTNTTYTATITTGVKDLSGNAVANDYVWSFTTGSAPDVTSPSVTATSPVDIAADVSIFTKIAATFSETMDSSTLTPSTFTLTDNSGKAVIGGVTYVGNIATFTPSGLLFYDTLYMATISAGVKDLAGNALANDVTWSFTTGAIPLPPRTAAAIAASVGFIQSPAGRSYIFGSYWYRQTTGRLRVRILLPICANIPWKTKSTRFSRTSCCSSFITTRSPNRC